MNYASLTQIKSYLRQSSSETSDDALLVTLARQASRFIESYKGRRYDPYITTLYLDIPTVPVPFGQYGSLNSTSIRSKSLILPTDLLEVIEFTNGNGETILSTEYCLEPLASAVKSIIVPLVGLSWAPSSDGNYRQAIALKGIFGYTDRYPECWVDSLNTVLDNPLSISSTTIKVSDVTGVDADLESPRFQTGQIVRLESEFVLITAVTAVIGGDDTLTVVRHVNGSTAAQHPTSTKIEVLKVFSPILQACIRIVAWRYAQKDTDSFDRSFNLTTGVSIIPSALPPDIRELLGSRKVARL